MNTGVMILSIGSVLGLAGMISLLFARNRLKMRSIAVLAFSAVVSLPVTGLLSNIPLICSQGGKKALLTMGARSVGESLPHTGVIPLVTTWPVLTILQWATFIVAVIGLIVLAMPKNRSTGRFSMGIGIAWLIFSLIGLAGLIGLNMDKTALQNLATYGVLARIPNSIEVFPPTINCETGASLSGMIFIFSGAFGIFNLIGGLPGYKRPKHGLFRPILMISVVFTLILGISFQFMPFSGYVRVFGVLVLIFGAIALIDRDTDFAHALGTLSFGLLMLMPFL